MSRLAVGRFLAPEAGLGLGEVGAGGRAEEEHDQHDRDDDADGDEEEGPAACGIGRHGEQRRRQAGQDRSWEERDGQGEAVGDLLALQRHCHAEDHQRQLAHHEDSEEAERRLLAEVDEADDPRQE